MSFSRNNEQTQKMMDTVQARLLRATGASGTTSSDNNDSAGGGGASLIDHPDPSVQQPSRSNSVHSGSPVPASSLSSAAIVSQVQRNTGNDNAVMKAATKNANKASSNDSSGPDNTNIANNNIANNTSTNPGTNPGRTHFGTNFGVNYNMAYGTTMAPSPTLYAGPTTGSPFIPASPRNTRTVIPTRIPNMTTNTNSPLTYARVNPGSPLAYGMRGNTNTGSPMTYSANRGAGNYGSRNQQGARRRNNNNAHLHGNDNAGLPQESAFSHRSPHTPHSTPRAGGPKFMVDKEKLNQSEQHSTSSDSSSTEREPTPKSGAVPPISKPRFGGLTFTDQVEDSQSMSELDHGRDGDSESSDVSPTSSFKESDSRDSHHNPGDSSPPPSDPSSPPSGGPSPVDSTPSPFRNLETRRPFDGNRNPSSSAPARLGGTQQDDDDPFYDPSYDPPHPPQNPPTRRVTVLASGSPSKCVTRDCNTGEAVISGAMGQYMYPSPVLGAGANQPFANQDPFVQQGPAQGPSMGNFGMPGPRGPMMAQPGVPSGQAGPGLGLAANPARGMPGPADLQRATLLGLQMMAQQGEFSGAGPFSGTMGGLAPRPGPLGGQREIRVRRVRPVPVTKAGSTSSGPGPEQALGEHQHLFAPGAYQPPSPPTAEVRGRRSAQLNALLAGEDGLPTIERALSPEFFPFVPCWTAASGACKNGVLKISNVPYGTTQPEVAALLGRNARTLADKDEPFIIIMDKVTFKTQNVYVEFGSEADARRCLDRIQANVEKKRLPKLGQRVVEVTMSSQEALMRDLFPFARGVVWDGNVPIIQQDDPARPWNNFAGFMTREEIIVLIKYVENPARSPFSKDCPQRPYECLISTLKKYPWFMPDHTTAADRQLMYTACFRLAWALRQILADPKYDPNESLLTKKLLKRLVIAVLLCPGFSCTQKDNVVVGAGFQGNPCAYNQPAYAGHWRHLHTLVPRPGASSDVIEWYITLIREETIRNLGETNPLKLKWAIERARECATTGYFGFLWVEVDLPQDPVGAINNWSLERIGMTEMAAVRKVVQRALTRAEWAKQENLQQAQNNNA